jgi:putative phage-type endonuclease
MTNDVTDVQQGSEEWKTLRLGKITASRVSQVMGKSRQNFLAIIAAERISKQAESFTNAAMQWGIDTEPFAREAYEARNGVKVVQVGFCLHPTIKDAGASPDGLVGDDGLIEIKCPNTSTHVGTLIDQKAPTKYIPQIQFQLACTGRQWCDFVSFDPRIEQSFFQIRVDRDNEYIEKMEKEVSEFLEEVDRLVNQIQGNTNE